LVPAAHPDAGAVAGDPERNSLHDLARFAGALAILWFHARGPGSWVGQLAMPVFFVLLGWYALASARTQPFARFAGRRFRRLMLPWFVWSAVYGALSVVKALTAGQPPFAFLEPWMLLSGTALHLWFLPFAFAASLALAITTRHAPGLLGPVPAAVICSVAALPALATDYAHAPIPAREWLPALPLVAWPALLWSLSRHGRPVWLALPVAALLAVAALMAGDRWLAAWFGLGLPAATACIGLRLPGSRQTGTPSAGRTGRGTQVVGLLGSLALPVYLVHWAALDFTAHSAGLDPAGPAGLALAVGLSVAAALAFRHLGWARWTG
jgi:peptidoglycan/LPS O-acetylase OafA/YrhL